jgi:hypothetical protein
MASRLPRLAGSAEAPDPPVSTTPYFLRLMYNPALNLPVNHYQ